MDGLINQMLSKYEIKTLEDKKNALKEVVQEVILCGLSRANFFNDAAFYGGTALRIFYGLDRFSEDLDFSLYAANSNFELKKYFSTLEKEIKSLGLIFIIEEKEKTKESNIRSAFLKGNTKENILLFYNENDKTLDIDKKELLKIKFEVDTNPPKFAGYETKFGLYPYPYQIRLYDKTSLFAGKIHAIICRAWENRTKGRDLYDYVFYLSLNVPVNLKHLKERFNQTGFKTNKEKLEIEELKTILIEKFKVINYSEAKEDVYPYIKDRRKLDVWSKEFFIEITNKLTGV